LKTNKKSATIVRKEHFILNNLSLVINIWTVCFWWRR